ncbi:MAG: hypothetical protein J6A75_05945 [Lachnospiraceae bacterium]|nr:hypothetical protein [Lachnospiraceae bacterium]
MEKNNQITPHRVIGMCMGNIIIGIAVALFRLSGFGVDSFSCLNLGVSGLVGLSFGTWQLIFNIVLLVVVFFTARQFIGWGTVVNMVFIGYIADFLCWGFAQCFGNANEMLWLRIVLLIIGCFCSPFGASFYMEANMGNSPWDTVAFIILKFTKNKISYRVARVSSDVTAVVVGTLAALAAGNSIWTVVGLATIITSVLNGPLIQFFKEKICCRYYK